MERRERAARHCAVTTLTFAAVPLLALPPRWGRQGAQRGAPGGVQRWAAHTTPSLMKEKCLGGVRGGGGGGWNVARGVGA